MLMLRPLHRLTQQARKGLFQCISVLNPIMSHEMHNLPRHENNWDEFASNVNFKNVSLVTPGHLTRFLFDKFKLKFVDSAHEKEPGIELLRNIAANYDYWIVRNDQSLLLYYRIQMMLQRINFLKSVGLTKQQKLRQIQKYPPILVFSFTDCSYNAKMVYLCGVTPKSSKEFMHMFHPITSKITLSKSDIEQRLTTISQHLNIKQPAILTELLNMPCFFMEPTALKSISHQFVHKYSLPFQFDIDKHTVGMFPAICNLPKIGLSRKMHFSNKTNNGIISQLPLYKIEELLDYSYPTTNGKGTLQCLSTFLIKAEKEEEKDRTGGQPLKGRRGFNVPPRQY